MVANWQLYSPRFACKSS